MTNEKENKRSNMPKKERILEYWAERILQEYPDKIHMDIYFENDTHISEKARTCFACGSHHEITERAHIVPISCGGGNELENLHLLCRECHLESEFIEERGTYFEWFAYKNSENSGSNLRRTNISKLFVSMISRGLSKQVLKSFPNALPIIENFNKGLY